MILRHKHITIFLAMLLLMTACQKVDDAMFQKTQKPPKENQNTENDRFSPDDEASLTKEAEDHVAILLESDGTTTSYLLISLNEWQNVCSANYDNGKICSSIAAQYREGDITGWRLPTKKEAEAIKAIYNCDASTHTPSDVLTSLNEKLTALGGMPMSAWVKKDGMPNWRYLCEGGTYSFSLSSDSNVSGAASTNKTTYYLRLVKDIDADQESPQTPVTPGIPPDPGQEPQGPNQDNPQGPGQEPQGPGQDNPGNPTPDTPKEPVLADQELHNQTTDSEQLSKSSAAIIF